MSSAWARRVTCLTLLPWLALLAEGGRTATAQFTGGAFVALGTFDGLQVELVTGPGGGRPPQVRVFYGSGTLDFQVQAYDPSFEGGVRVAVCDLDGDAVDEIVTAPGPGMEPRVKIFRVSFTPPNPAPQVTEAYSFLAYDATAQGGVFVACGNVLGASPWRNQILTGAGEGGEPRARVWDVDLEVMAHAQVTEGLAYDPAFRGGVRVAVGDFDTDGKAEIVVGPGPGAASVIHVVRLEATSGTVTGVSLLATFEAIGSFTGGVFLAMANVETAFTGGLQELIVGPGTGAGSQVRLFGVVPGLGVRSADLLVFPPGLSGGTAVTGGHLLAGVDAQIVAASGPGIPTTVRVLDVDGTARTPDLTPY
jgi:hypothetical protein